VPHRRGSFHEDWNELLARFAHKGTPAEREEQFEQAKGKDKKRKARARAWDFHQQLFERSHH
jgi:hypothetical protein